MKKSLKVFTTISAVIGIVVAIAIIGIVLLTNHDKNLVTINGPAMSPTLKSGQEVTLVQYAPASNPQRGDIVEFAERGQSSNKSLILRIIGVPEDHIVISNGKVTIFNSQNPNGFNPDSAYLSEKATTSGQTDVTLQQNQYFVLGDNRSNSLDSRIFGPITIDQILGKVTQ